MPTGGSDADAAGDAVGAEAGSAASRAGDDADDAAGAGVGTAILRAGDEGLSADVVSSADEVEEKFADATAARRGEASSRCLRAPRNFLAQLHRLFAATDARGVESMCWLLGRRAAGGNSPCVDTVLVTDHVATDCTVRDTETGATQVVEFLIDNAELIVLAWCHSHHKLLGAPSSADLMQQWRIERLEGLGLAMVIVWRAGAELYEGMSAHCIRAAVREVLDSRAGSIDTSRERAQDYLEAIRLVEDGCPARVVHKGACVGSRQSQAPQAPGNKQHVVAGLEAARADDLLQFLRRRRETDGNNSWVANSWIGSAPIVAAPGDCGSIEQCEKAVMKALEHLLKCKHVTLSRPKDARWKVREWTVTLL